MFSVCAIPSVSATEGESTTQAESTTLPAFDESGFDGFKNQIEVANDFVNEQSDNLSLTDFARFKNVKLAGDYIFEYIHDDVKKLIFFVLITFMFISIFKALSLSRG